MWTKLASRAIAAVVALVAGVISYGHIRQVALASGELEVAAALLPVGIDGLIIVGTLAMLEDKRQRRYPRLSARVALGFGIAATVGFNIASAEPSWSARAVAVVPAVSFLLAVEVLVRTGRRIPAPDDTITTTDPAAAADALAAAVAAVDNTPDPDPAPAGAAVAVQVSTPDTDTRTGSASRATGTRSSSSRSRSAARSRPSAAERVRKAAAETPDATSAQIAARLGLSERTVQRYRPKPAQVDNSTGDDSSTPAVDNPTGGNPTGAGSSAVVDNPPAVSAVDSEVPDLFSSNGNNQPGRVPLVGSLTRN